MNGMTLLGLVVGAPLLITYVAVIVKLTLDYLTTKEVFHGPSNNNKGGN